MLSDVKPNDSLFFHYSGHGSQVKDKSGDEDDNQDEVIIPLDFESAGVISDDVLKALISKKLPEGVR